MKLCACSDGPLDATWMVGHRYTPAISDYLSLPGGQQSKTPGRNTGRTRSQQVVCFMSPSRRDISNTKSLTVLEYGLYWQWAGVEAKYEHTCIRFTTLHTRGVALRFNKPTSVVVWLAVDNLYRTIADLTFELPARHCISQINRPRTKPNFR